MVGKKKESNKKGAQNLHIKTRRTFDEVGKKLENRATILLHKEKMIENMKLNNWTATDVASFY